MTAWLSEITLTSNLQRVCRGYVGQMLGDFLSNFEQSDFVLDGFFNVEGGLFAIATDYFNQCQSVDQELNLYYGPDGCDCGCGRSSSTYLAGHAGDGDGVYTSWRFRIGEDKYAGFAVVFDSNYDLANYAMESLGNERWTELPFSELKKYGSTKAFHLGTMSSVSTLLVGDSGFMRGGPYPAIDFFGDERDFEIFSFMESPGTQLGVVPNESRHLTRVLVAIAADYSNQLLRSEFQVGDIEMTHEFMSGMWEVQMSHKLSMSNTIGDANFVCKNVALKHLGPGHLFTTMQAWSWLLWDLEWGFKDVEEVLDVLRSMGYEDDPDLLLVALRIRGLDDSTLEKLNEVAGTIRASRVGESPSLPKTSNGLPKSKDGSLGKISRPKYCTNCGDALSAVGSYCGQCGSPVG